jgi:LacI family gluconate utilization system Gnt-I transcriptional repressor
MSTKFPARPKSRTPGIRMEDVAELAGVTIMTVSRAINTPEKVAPGTRERIEKAIAKVGYVPNLAASSLASKRSRIVAAIVPTISNSTFADTVRGLSDTLATEGYQLLLGQTGYDEAREEALVFALLGRHVDGVVLTGVRHSKALVKRLRSLRIPVVETWDLTDTPIDMVAGFSNFDAGREIGRYLLGKGHRCLGFSGGEGDRTDSRLEGLRSAMKSTRGARLVTAVLPVGTTFRTGREALRLLLEKESALDAIFFANDAVAVGALMECQRRGIRVPRDLAIVGFTDLDIASEIEPGLTTVHVRSHDIGVEAARMLLMRFKAETVEQPIRDLGFALVKRASA